ncbi:MAG TPA: hypothetical protein VMU78_04425, partial [Methylocella sp.]|nr:hypothetical protein [Methylocella sp.]
TTRMQTQMEAAKVRILHDFRYDIAKDFDKLTAGRVRAEIWKISFAAVVVLTASVAAGLAVGYKWGRANTETTIHETESRLMAAFRDGTSAALLWADLMTWNNINASLNQCHTRPDLSFVQNGRHFCNIPLWLDPDEAAPNTEQEELHAGQSRN